MARLTIKTNVTLNLDEVFEVMRDIYEPKQLARMAVRMGTANLDEYEFAELLIREACKVVKRKVNIECENQDYADAVRFLADYEV